MVQLFMTSEGGGVNRPGVRPEAVDELVFDAMLLEAERLVCWPTLDRKVTGFDESGLAVTATARTLTESANN